MNPVFRLCCRPKTAKSNENNLGLYAVYNFPWKSEVNTPTITTPFFRKCHNGRYTGDNDKKNKNPCFFPMATSENEKAF